MSRFEVRCTLMMSLYRVRLLVLSVVCGLAPPAFAEPDVFSLGSGAQGNVTVSTPNTRVNVYTALTQARQPGDMSLSVASTANLSAGDLLMVHLPGGLTPPAAGELSDVDLSSTPSGRWEFAVIQTIDSSSQLTLTAPLSRAYPSTGAQVIRIPQYQTLVIQSGASIVAKHWDGASGGVIAFLVKDTFTNNGTVNATNAGFRGGLFIDNPGVQSGCIDLNEPSPTGAQKGEGLATRAYGAGSTGRGNLANAGGGGNCHNTGGGGGGHGGRGGQGGDSFAVPGGAPTAPLGGMGGAAVQSSLEAYLTFGGGGGAGHGNDAKGTGGAKGGGAVLVRARVISGNGVFSARGGNGLDIAGFQGDGAGGGGAGGSISLRAVDSIQCQLASAAGGNGGSILGASNHGPGGGGGGGKVLVQASSILCPAEVIAGLAGTEAMGSHFGATPTDASQPPYVGDVESTLTGIQTPAAPVLASPLNGFATTTALLTLSGTAPPGATVVVFYDHAEVQRATTNSGGSWSVSSSTPLRDGVHTVYVHTVNRELFSARSNSIQVTVDATPPSPPLISKPANNEVVGAAFRTILGTAEPGSVVTLTLDGHTVAELQPASNGVWSFDISAPLNDGAHDLRANARDGLNNTSTESERAFTVDLQPADTQILSGPRKLTQLRQATFEFTSEDSMATFECRLDGKNFQPCTSPVTFEKLSFDRHVFAVRSIDAAGNIDPSPAEHPWLVDIMGGGLACSCSNAPAASAWGLPLLVLLLARVPRRRRFP